MADRVLIVDDDEAVLNILNKVVKSNGISAVLVSSGEEALKKISEERFDLILLDINMHGINGFEVIEQLRNDKNTTPIIVVSGRKDDFETLYCLDIGADDYVTKPFNPITLGAKVKALIRRSKNTSGDISGSNISAGPFSYNTTTLRLYKNGSEIALTSKENAMIKLFLDNPNRIFSKDMIYDLIWGELMVDENAVMVYINRLRQKIEDDPGKPKYLQNVRGLGYRFVI